MRARHKIFDALKDAPEDWRYVKCTQKKAYGNKYTKDTTFTLEEVLEQDGDGVGVLLGRHSLTTINETFIRKSTSVRRTPLGLIGIDRRKL